MKAKAFYAHGKPEGYHPGYDGSSRSALYDFVGLSFSLYDWEMK